MRPIATGHVFRAFWHRGPLSPLEWACVTSFVEHEHDYVLYSYGDVANAPAGCRVEDAREILPEESVFFYTDALHMGSVAGFSNLFRYELLKKEGGWWVDTDVLCLSSKVPDDPYVFAKEDETLYGNAILRVPDSCPLIEQALRRAHELSPPREFGVTGPRLITELVVALELEANARPTAELYPLPWTRALEILNPDKTRQIETATLGSPFMHLWTSVLKMSNVLTAVRPPAGSFLDQVYRRLGVAFQTDLEYRWADVASVVLLQEHHQGLARQHQALDREVTRLQALVDDLRSENEALGHRWATRYTMLRALRKIGMPVYGIGMRLGWRWPERAKDRIYYALFPESK